MDRLEELKKKYQSVLALIPQKGVKLAHLHVEGNKLYMKGASPSQEVTNAIWNEIKRVDSTFADLTCDLTIDPSLAPPAAPPPQAKAPKTYTVVKGDSLWKIAQEHLRNGAHFPKIIAANPGKLKDEKSVIHPGDVLVIPEK